VHCRRRSGGALNLRGNGVRSSIAADAGVGSGLCGAVALGNGRKDRRVGMGAVLKHAETILAMLSRVEVVVLQAVHLAVALGAPSTNSTDIRARAFLGFFEGKTVVNGVVNGKVALPENESVKRTLEAGK
jgi:hypothetical protein